RLVKLARVAFATRLGQRFETLERQVEEDGSGTDDVDVHENSSATSVWRREYASRIRLATLTDGTSGCRARAFRASSRDPGNAARIVSRSTSLIDPMRASAWAGTPPTATGCAPVLPTMQGTSTTASASRNGRLFRFAVLRMSRRRWSSAIASTTASASPS